MKLLFKKALAMLLSVMMLAGAASVYAADGTRQNTDGPELLFPTGGAVTTAIPLTAADAAAAEAEDGEHFTLALSPKYAAATDYSRYGYEQLGTQTNGTRMQQFYNLIEADAEKIHAGTKSVSTQNVNGTVYYHFGPYNYLLLGITQLQAGNVFHVLRADHPEYFWIDTGYLYGSGSIYPLVGTEFASAGKRAECITQMNTALAGYAALFEGDESNYEIALRVHDEICDAVEYSYVNGQPDNGDYAHCVMGVFDTSVSKVVCEGYARAYQLILRELGVPTIYIGGVAGGGGHAWNAVQMDDGIFYCVDLTWDDQPNLTTGMMHSYFNMPASSFDDDHTADTPSSGADIPMYELPALGDTAAYTFYSKTGTDATGLSDTAGVARIINSAAVYAVESGKYACEVYLPSGGYSEFWSCSSYFTQMLAESESIAGKITGTYSNSVVSSNGLMYIIFTADNSTPQPSVKLYKNGAAAGEYLSLKSALAELGDGQADYTAELYDSTATLPLTLPWTAARSLTFRRTSGAAVTLYMYGRLDIPFAVTLENTTLRSHNYYDGADGELYTGDSLLTLKGSCVLRAIPNGSAMVENSTRFYNGITGLDISTLGGCVRITENQTYTTVTSAQHSFTSVVTPASCTEDGFTTKTCSSCGHIEITDTVAMLGHAWGEWTVTTAPTYETEGVKSRSCSRCGESQTDTIEVLVRLRGDWDGDGTVTITDALEILRIAAELYMPTPAEKLIADVDNDGSVTATDALRVLRTAAGL